MAIYSYKTEPLLDYSLAENRDKYREALKKGDKIVTTGGIYGKVSEIKEDKVIMEISENVKITIDKSAVIMDMSDAVRK